MASWPRTASIWNHGAVLRRSRTIVLTGEWPSSLNGSLDREAIHSDANMTIPLTGGIKMKNFYVFALVLAVCGALFTPVLAQESPDAGVVVPYDDYQGGVNRYLVTYMTSQTDTAIRTATVVTVTNPNATSPSCAVRIEWFQGFVPNTPVCTTAATIAPGVTHDFCSRSLPNAITACNSVCAPALNFDEGKAIVSSSENIGCGLIAAEARVYYTTGAGDMAVSAISNPKIVEAERGNLGD
jgi:hypothetical protein